MIKYIPQDTQVVFEEIPDEITLAVNISNCQNRCPGCHSAYLCQNIGEELTENAVDGLIRKNEGITCFCFMGEGNDAESLEKLILYVKEKYPKLKVGLYSGREVVHDDFFFDTLDYIKIGPYIESCGPLNIRTTNQRLYENQKTQTACRICGIVRVGWVDITHKIWERYENIH